MLFAGLLVQVWILDQEDLARNALPVTPIDQLIQGARVKINGTIVAGVTVVIDEVGTGNTRHWSLSPFNISDSTGSVYVLVGPLQGSRSYREIQTGIHDHDWWIGDAVSLIGDVESNVPGTVYIVARYIARTPSSFYRPDPALAVFLGLAAVADGTFGALNYLLDWRRRRLHAKNGPEFPYKVTEWPRCQNCGEYVDPAGIACPGCGETVSVKTPPARRAIDLRGLPAIRLRTSFGNKSRTTRVVALALGLGFPIIILATLLVAVVVSGFFSQAGIISFTLLLVVATPCFATLVGSYLFQETITLSPAGIESRKLFRRVTVDPLVVDRLVTIDLEDVRTHGAMTRTGPSIFFGEGFSRSDLEQAQAWLRDLSSRLGVRYHESLRTHEEILAITGRG